MLARKVRELTENTQASMTLWLPLQQREVIIDGNVEPLIQDENKVQNNDTSPICYF